MPQANIPEGAVDEARDASADVQLARQVNVALIPPLNELSSRQAIPNQRSDFRPARSKCSCRGARLGRQGPSEFLDYRARAQPILQAGPQTPVLPPLPRRNDRHCTAEAPGSVCYCGRISETACQCRLALCGTTHRRAVGRRQHHAHACGYVEVARRRQGVFGLSSGSCQLRVNLCSQPVGHPTSRPGRVDQSPARRRDIHTRRERQDIHHDNHIARVEHGPEALLTPFAMDAVAGPVHAGPLSGDLTGSGTSPHQESAGIPSSKSQVSLRLSLHLSPTICCIVGYVGACCVTLRPSSPCSSRASPRQVGPSRPAAPFEAAPDSVFHSAEANRTGKDEQRSTNDQSSKPPGTRRADRARSLSRRMQASPEAHRGSMRWHPGCLPARSWTEW
jgi:hypothetical protein